MKALLPLCLIIALSCAPPPTAKSEPPTPTPTPSKPTQKVYSEALAFFDYSTPDEWKSWLQKSSVSDSGVLTVQVASPWFAMPKHEQRSYADQIVKRWKVALGVGGEDNATPTVRMEDSTGHRVAGSSAWGGAWIED